MGKLINGVLISKSRKGKLIFHLPTGYGGIEFIEWKNRNKGRIKRIKVRK